MCYDEKQERKRGRRAKEHAQKRKVRCCAKLRWGVIGHSAWQDRRGRMALRNVKRAQIRNARRNVNQRLRIDGPALRHDEDSFQAAPSPKYRWIFAGHRGI